MLLTEVCFPYLDPKKKISMPLFVISRIYCTDCLIDNKVYIVIELVFILKLNCSGTNTQNKRKFVIDSKGLFGVCSVIKNR